MSQTFQSFVGVDLHKCTVSLGGVDPAFALKTYWMLGTQGMVGVEFLTNLGKLPEKAYFLFAPVRIRDCFFQVIIIGVGGEID